MVDLCQPLPADTAALDLAVSDDLGRQGILEQPARRIIDLAASLPTAAA